ncbi:3-hydroxyacyl-CoA dehydrogenase NAD-binding domain-containing protein [Telmatospirillum sp. J64-1]|uniref:3-hydroxyacyl-CoA dehydrogenase NAD-binding domain-containing protein n=1 Tax=Telmatospirillum sp. J64-1 TaxID=2502183 RepID=UPI00115CEB39|nr:3-hydroxyacyl-CoA dehydrogenase NAD-binding domain-containing protein [Telmatospirillum sp. J64-1]
MRPVGTVAVLGGGTIGAGWAGLFAAHGLTVRVADPGEGVAGRVAEAVANAHAVARALGQGVQEPSSPQVTASLEEAVSGADFIQETLPERLALKYDVFRAVEEVAGPDVVIASSSSGLSPSELQQGLRHPERLVIGHPCNPPYLMPVVEVVGGGRTSAEAVAQALAFYRGLGKQALHVRREAPGHLVNRLQAALWREAVHLVAEGYASVEDVDAAVTQGLGPRWAVCGPHTIFHLAGGPAGMEKFLKDLGGEVERWWASLGQPSLTPEVQAALIDGMAAAAKDRPVAQLAAERDRVVVGVLKAVAAERRKANAE